jgi:putative sterol carrier protein
LNLFQTPIKAYSIPLNLKEWFSEDATKDKRENIKRIIKHLAEQQEQEALKIQFEKDTKKENEEMVHQKGPKKQKMSIDLDQDRDVSMVEEHGQKQRIEIKPQPNSNIRTSTKIINDLKNL